MQTFIKPTQSTPPYQKPVRRSINQIHSSNHFQIGINFIILLSNLTSILSFFVTIIPTFLLNLFINSTKGLNSLSSILFLYFTSMGISSLTMSISLPFFQKDKTSELFIANVSTILPKKSSSILVLYK